MITSTDYIPKNKFQEFHKILCSTGGFYLQNPIILGEKVFVNFEYGDYKQHCHLWDRLNTEIKEVRYDQKWRIFLRRYLKINI